GAFLSFSLIPHAEGSRGALGGRFAAACQVLGAVCPGVRCCLPGAGQASRVAIFQAPMTDQPMIQPAMTVIIAQVGIGGRGSIPGAGPTGVPPASAAGFSWSMATP